MNETRLQDIEAKLMFQEQSMNELSEVLYGQQQQISVLEATCESLLERLRGLADAGAESSEGHEPPPHY